MTLLNKELVLILIRLGMGGLGLKINFIITKLVVNSKIIKLVHNNNSNNNSRCSNNNINNSNNNMMMNMIMNNKKMCKINN